MKGPRECRFVCEHTQTNSTRQGPPSLISYEDAPNRRSDRWNKDGTSTPSINHDAIDRQTRDSLLVGTNHDSGRPGGHQSRPGNTPLLRSRYTAETSMSRSAMAPRPRRRHTTQAHGPNTTATTGRFDFIYKGNNIIHGQKRYHTHAKTEISRHPSPCPDSPPAPSAAGACERSCCRYTIRFNP